MNTAAQGIVHAPPQSTDRGEERRAGRGAPVRQPSKGFAVVHLTAEYWPFAPAGGLAEAVRGRAEHQAAEGRPVFVVLPLYRGVRENSDLVPASEPLEIPMGARHEPARFYQLAEPPVGPRVLFLDHPSYFDRP